MNVIVILFISITTFSHVMYFITNGLSHPCASRVILWPCADLNLATDWNHQVEQIVEKAPSLKRISFVAHSLGGLFARFAVAMLYTPKDDQTEDMVLVEELENRGEAHPVFRRRREARIAGLEAVSFITLASPHLGVRGKNQVLPQRKPRICMHAYYSLEEMILILPPA